MFEFTWVLLLHTPQILATFSFNFQLETFNLEFPGVYANIMQIATIFWIFHHFRAIFSYPHPFLRQHRILFN